MLGLGNHHRVDLHFIGRQKALDESGLSVNGIGIRVGVLSDSFNDLGGAAADEADGALPPAADLIKDLASGGTDEGRAMMQIIYDIAPGADLAFYTAFDSDQDFANGILAHGSALVSRICPWNTRFSIMESTIKNLCRLQRIQPLQFGLLDDTVAIFHARPM